jgi:hypothetical protein
MFGSFLGAITNTVAPFQGLVTNLITAGHGREAAFAAAVLGDNALMEKAWQDTGMLAEAVLHAQVSFILNSILSPILPNLYYYKKLEFGVNQLVDIHNH